MSTELAHSVFYQVLFPETNSETQTSSDFALRKTLTYSIDPLATLRDQPLVVFDFETTGLDASRDRIIEIGAQKIVNEKVVGEISTLLSTDIALSEVVQKLTGITGDMLVGKPSMGDYLPNFLEFIEGAVLVAHNIDFDMSMLVSECSRQGIDFTWPGFCTLKMARELLPELERKNLDTLAEHYSLTFESRHRSIGDVKVTTSVLNNMLEDEGGNLVTWKDFQPFYAKQ